MSKSRILLTSVLACSLALALAACAPSTFGLASSNDGTITISAENKASGETTSTIKVTEGYGVRIFPSVEEGAITVTIADEQDRQIYSGILNGASNPAYVNTPAGELSVQASADKADGKVEIGLYALPERQDRSWTAGDKDSAASAAAAAGVETFSVPIPISIADRQIGSPKYHAAENTASAVYSARGMSVTIAKSKDAIDGGGTKTVEVGNVSVSCHGDGVYDSGSWDKDGDSYTVKVEADDASMGIAEDEVKFFVEKVA